MLQINQQLLRYSRCNVIRVVMCHTGVLLELQGNGIELGIIMYTSATRHPCCMYAHMSEWDLRTEPYLTTDTLTRNSIQYISFVGSLSHYTLLGN